MAPLPPNGLEAIHSAHTFKDSLANKVTRPSRLNFSLVFRRDASLIPDVPSVSSIPGPIQVPRAPEIEDDHRKRLIKFIMVFTLLLTFVVVMYLVARSWTWVYLAKVKRRICFWRLKEDPQPAPAADPEKAATAEDCHLSTSSTLNHESPVLTETASNGSLAGVRAKSAGGECGENVDSAGSVTDPGTEALGSPPSYWQSERANGKGDMAKSSSFFSLGTGRYLFP